MIPNYHLEEVEGSLICSLKMTSTGVAISPIQNGSAMPPSFVNAQPQPGTSQQESIMIYLAVSGVIMPMRILESDSIESVKLRIQSHQGFMVKSQKLVCGGRELSRNSSLVREYGVTDGNVLHLVLKLSDLQAISVKTVSGNEFTFQVERGKDVGYVKQQIAEKEKGLGDLAEQEVLYNGEQVGDQMIINDLCKHNDAVIYLLVRKSAKVRYKPVKKNFELSIVAPPENHRQDDEVGGVDKGQFDVGEDNRSYPVERKPS